MNRGAIVSSPCRERATAALRTEVRRQDMRMSAVVSRLRAFIPVAATVLGASSARTQPIDGAVQGGGGPIATATVPLWAAGPGAPKKLGETRTRDDAGRLVCPLCAQ